MNLAKVGGILVATVLSAILAALTGDQTIQPTEWVNVLIAVVGVITVYVVPNVSGSVGAYAKSAVAAASAGLVFLQSGISDGMSGTEWIQLAVTALGAIGVFALPGPMVAAVTGRHKDGTPFLGSGDTGLPPVSGSTSEL